jgi:4-hydroxy-3-methylbut-2-en-1-yl diphosphate reductase
MNNRELKEIHLASTQGFCAGVASAIEVVDRALVKYGTPLYVRHHIVHNTTVISDFEKRGVVFIEDLEDVPSNKTVIFSAHGTAPYEFKKAKDRGLTVIDATCPLVTKIHREAVRFSAKGVQTVLIGHKGHQELIGTSGYVDSDNLHIIENEKDVESLKLDEDRPIGFLTQTTLSVDDTQGIITRLKDRYPGILGPPKAGICFATTNRQNVVKELAGFCDIIIVCGSPTSSNSNRLRESSSDLGVTAYIIDTVDELDLAWLDNKSCLGITSGASVPKKVVDAVVERILDAYRGVSVIQKESKEKGIKFPIPNI